MTEFLLQQIVNALAIGAIYALIALGYTMVYGVLQLINFAHGEMFMLGAYAAFYLLAWTLGPLGGGGIGAIGVTLLFFASFAVIGAVGMGTERIAYRPLRDASRLAPMLSALGVSILLQNAVQLLIGPQPIKFPEIIRRQQFEFGGVVVSNKHGLILVAALVLMGALHWFVRRTRFGVHIRAVSESHQTARLLGINVDRTVAIVFLIGPGLGAVAGVLWSSYYGIMQFSMGVSVGLKAFTAAILGGIGSIPGAMLGGLLLGLLETLGAGFLPFLTGGRLGSEYRDIFAFAVLVLVLLFRPAGLMGEPVTEESMVYKKDF